MSINLAYKSRLWTLDPSSGAYLPRQADSRGFAPNRTRGLGEAESNNDVSTREDILRSKSKNQAAIILRGKAWAA